MFLADFITLHVANRRYCDAFRASEKLFARRGNVLNACRNRLRSQAISRNKLEGHTIRRSDFRKTNVTIGIFLRLADFALRNAYKKKLFEISPI